MSNVYYCGRLLDPTPLYYSRWAHLRVKMQRFFSECTPLGEFGVLSMFRNWFERISHRTSLVPNGPGTYWNRNMFPAAIPMALSLKTGPIAKMNWSELNAQTCLLLLNAQITLLLLNAQTGSRIRRNAFSIFQLYIMWYSNVIQLLSVPLVPSFFGRHFHSSAFFARPNLVVEWDCFV